MPYFGSNSAGRPGTRGFGQQGAKRFAEDPGTVFAQAGHAPGDTVKLVLGDPQSEEIVTVDRAPMTRENRFHVWQARNNPHKQAASRHGDPS